MSPFGAVHEWGGQTPNPPPSFPLTNSSVNVTKSFVQRDEAFSGN